MKKCFVISPIGSEGSEIREHANDVYNYIIKPAMEEVGITALRSDHLNEPGKITEQMFRELFGSDLCVAVLTGHNPNVFYELALAQASGRPVIILIERSEDLPFDIRDLRAVTYDFKPSNIVEKVFVRQLVDHLQNLDRLNWQVESPFSGYDASSAWFAAGNQPKFYERFSHFGSTKEWLGVIGSTKNRCDLMSLTLDSWKNRSGFKELIARKAQEGCRIRFLQMHEDNPMLRNFAAEPKSYEYLAPMAKLTREYFQSMTNDLSNVEFRQIREGCPHFRIVLTDEQAFMSPYSYSSTSSPVFEASNNCNLYESIRVEFEGLWRKNGG